MSERFQRDVSDFRVPISIEQFQPLPGWLADRLLRPDEKVTWVRGPRFNPSWERYITHPASILLASGLGLFSLSLAWPFFMGLPSFAVFAAAMYVFFVFFLPSLFVVGIACGYFTRLVVTNFRIVIIQGYEICRTWNIDDLPPSLLRYRRFDGEHSSRCIDLDTVKTMLGGSSDKFTDSKTILAFGKHLDRITKRDKDHL